MKLVTIVGWAISHPKNLPKKGKKPRPDQLVFTPKKWTYSGENSSGRLNRTEKERDEEKKVQREADYQNSERGRGRDGGQGFAPPPWDCA